MIFFFFCLGACWRFWILAGDPADLLRQLAHAARHHRYRRGWRTPPAGHHHCADRLQEEVARCRPHPQTAAAADGQPRVQGGPRVQRRWAWGGKLTRFGPVCFHHPPAFVPHPPNHFLWLLSLQLTSKAPIQQRGVRFSLHFLLSLAANCLPVAGWQQFACECVRVCV